MARMCEACGKENPDYGEYCGACGRALASVGAQAGRRASTLVCGRCGGPMDGSGICPRCSEEYPDRIPLFKVTSIKDPVTIVGATVFAIGIASLIYSLIFIASWLYFHLVIYTGTFEVADGHVGLFAALFIVFGGVTVIGGMCAMGRTNYGWALAGALSAVVIGFLLGAVLLVVAVMCVVFITVSRNDFPPSPWKYRA